MEDDFAFRVNAGKDIGKEEDNNGSWADMVIAFGVIRGVLEGLGKAEIHNYHWDRDLLGEQDSVGILFLMACYSFDEDEMVGTDSSCMMVLSHEVEELDILREH